MDAGLTHCRGCPGWKVQPVKRFKNKGKVSIRVMRFGNLHGNVDELGGKENLRGQGMVVEITVQPPLVDMDLANIQALWFIPMSVKGMAQFDHGGGQDAQGHDKGNDLYCAFWMYFGHTPQR